MRGQCCRLNSWDKDRHLSYGDEDMYIVTKVQTAGYNHGQVWFKVLHAERSHPEETLEVANVLCTICGPHCTPC
jgi:hypothetical protein